MIRINIKGLCDPKTKNGLWSFAVKGSPYRGQAQNTTSNRMELMAAIKALEHFNAPQEITILCNSHYITMGANYYSRAWIRNDWKNSEGEDVKNKDLWQRLLEARNKHSKVLFKSKSY